jgi:hypothetical protein
MTGNEANKYYDVIYSPDDGGYYCEIYTYQGKTISRTRIYKTQKEAEEAVLKRFKRAHKIAAF